MRLLLGERLLSRVVHFLAASDDLKRAINQWALQRIRLWVVNSEVCLPSDYRGQVSATPLAVIAGKPLK